MSKIYTIEYRWRGRSFHTVVAGADRRAAVAEFRREFPHVDVMAGGAGRAVKSVCRLVMESGRGKR